MQSSSIRISQSNTDINDSLDYKKKLKDIISGKISQESVINLVKSENPHIYEANLKKLISACKDVFPKKSFIEKKLGAALSLIAFLGIDVMQKLNVAKPNLGARTTISVLDIGTTIFLFNYTNILNKYRVTELGIHREMIVCYKKLLEKVVHSSNRELLESKAEFKAAMKQVRDFEDSFMHTSADSTKDLLLFFGFYTILALLNTRQLTEQSIALQYSAAVFTSILTSYFLSLGFNALTGVDSELDNIKEHIIAMQNVIEHGLNNGQVSNSFVQYIAPQAVDEEIGIQR